MDYRDWQMPLRQPLALKLIYYFVPCQIIHPFKEAFLHILIIISVFFSGRCCRVVPWKADSKPEIRGQRV